MMGERMKILVADDDAIHRTILETVLTDAGHEVVTAEDGLQAWQIISEPDAPRIAILDWVMPGLEGPQICARVRAEPALQGMHLILLTSREKKEHIVHGLDAGANDYLTKPFHEAELLARISAGVRIVDLQQTLATRVAELEHALAQVHRLEGLLPICSYCRRVRNEDQYWESVETYISQRSDAKFTHGVCPTCADTVLQKP